MKNMKRLSAILVALVMALSLALPAFADGEEETAKVTIPEALESHELTAYQIFSAGSQKAVEKDLGDIAWGSGIDADAFVAALIEAFAPAEGSDQTNPFSAGMSAQEVAKAIAAFSYNDAYANKVAKAAYDCVTDGVVISGTTELPLGYYLILDTTEELEAGDAANAALLEVVNDLTIRVKKDRTSVEKKVQENSTGEYQGHADYSIGDAVPFVLVGKVASDVQQYSTYFYAFSDTLSSGLTAPAAADVKVYFSADAVLDDADADVTDSFSITVVGQAMSIQCDDILAIEGVAPAGKYFIVSYSATLNEGAVVGAPGNDNKVSVIYSNDPNKNTHGTTPESKVLVFTYELDTTKIDANSPETKLSGAEFKLYRMDGEDAEYAVLDENGKVSSWTKVEDEATVLVSGDDGLFKVIGLDQGSYLLKETKAPAGYNILQAPIAITITATNDIAGELDTLKIQVGEAEAVDGEVESGIVAMNVANNSGALLPETGGIGTTIFYVVGGAMVIGALILLITKKKMNV